MSMKTDRQLRLISLKEYIKQEVDQATLYAGRGIDGHGRPITYKSAYISRTRANAHARWNKANNIDKNIWAEE